MSIEDFNSILSPVYLVQTPLRSYFLIAFKIDNSYGLVSREVIHQSQVKPDDPGTKPWGYRLKRFKGLFVAEITPKIELCGGLLETPDIWRPIVVQVDESQTESIKAWIDELNATNRDIL